MGLVKEWDELSQFEQQMYKAEACLCYSCYAYQEAKQVDAAMNTHVDCWDSNRQCSSISI